MLIISWNVQQKWIDCDRFDLQSKEVKYYCIKFGVDQLETVSVLLCFVQCHGLRVETLMFLVFDPDRLANDSHECSDFSGEI